MVDSLHQERNMKSSLTTSTLNLAIFCAMALSLTGCGYPEVSPQSYELSKALFSACNRKDEDHLSRVETMISEGISDGTVSQREADWLNQIIADARDGDWQSAAAESRQLMNDQVQR